MPVLRATGRVRGPPRVTPRARLGRAAMFAFGVAASSQAGCDNLPSLPDASISVDAPPDDALDAGIVPIYAAAPTKDSSTKSLSCSPSS